MIIFLLLLGTHWLLEIVYLIQTNGDVDKVNRCMMEQGLEFTMCAGPSDVPKTKPGYKYMEEWKSPRVMMTHLLHQFFPPQVWGTKAKVSVVLFITPKKVDGQFLALQHAHASCCL